MSSYLVRVDPPDIYHRHGLAGMSLARDAVDIRGRLVSEGRWDEIERNEADYIRAIQEGLDEVARLRGEVLARLDREAARDGAPRAQVADAGLGKVSMGGRTASTGAATDAALAANLSRAGAAAEKIADLSGLLARQRGRARGAQTLGEYVEASRRRLAALVCVSDEERTRVAELARVLDELSRTRMDAESARRVVGSRLDALERDLSAGGERRASDLATYLALCQTLGERPRARDYAHLLEEVALLEKKLVDRKAREVVARKVSAALERAGLRDVGTSVLGGAERRLLAAEGERACGLALSQDDAGSFMITTVAAVDPARASRERRAALEAAARRLCSTKQRRLLEELEREGLVAAVSGHDDDLSDMGYSVELDRALSDGDAERMRAERSGSRSRGREAGEP